MTSHVLGFDIYGTLIDPHGQLTQLRDLIGDDAEAFSQLWRQKQLEYTFRRGLMEAYVDFAQCTHEALQYVIANLAITISAADQQRLLAGYTTLPAYPEAIQVLQTLQQSGYTMMGFSNGTASGVKAVLQHNGLLELMDDVVSVDEIGTFKPDPAVYRHFVKRSNTNEHNAVVVSSNGFDVIGALHAGLKAIWVQRNPQEHLDAWGLTPNAIIDSLQELPAALAKLAKPQ